METFQKRDLVFFVFFFLKKRSCNFISLAIIITFYHLGVCVCVCVCVRNRIDINFFYCCDGWGYIVAFKKFLQCIKYIEL
jgi:hypothetical protein